MGTKKFVIPLKYICGFFRPTVRDMLIPAGLASGMRIEITLQTAARALRRVLGAGTGIGYTVSNPQMLFMLHDLSDSVQATLMNESANNGLEYTFPSYFSTPFVAASAVVNEQVKKSVSNCTRVFTVARVTADVADETQDGYSSIASSVVTSFQYRVGSSYYPQNPILSDVEAWYVTSSCFGKNAHSDTPNFIGLDEYTTGGQYLVGVPLETSSKLNLSGLPINNSSVLELRLVFTGAVNRDVTIFMEYITVARTFVNKTTTKI